MTDLQQQWARLLESGQARWAPGMRAGAFGFVDMIDERGRPYRQGWTTDIEGRVVPDESYPSRNTVPDFDSPATIGALTGLASDVLNVPDLAVVWCPSREQWLVCAGATTANIEIYGRGDSKAAALLNALESAPTEGLGR